MRKSTIYLFVLGLAVVVTAALASAGLVVSAQNTNSAMTMTKNTNTGAKKTKPRRHKPKTTATMGMGRCDPTKQEQTDLSGTYKGKATHPDGTVVSDATLTITGNTFNMNAGSDVMSGRITAVTTCGYTAVTMMSGDMTPPAPSPNPPAPNTAVSLRAKKVGDRLTLTSVPGEPRKVSFVSQGATMKAKPRKRRAKAKAKTTTTTATKPATPPMKH